MNESFAFSDLCRRVANLIRIGKIAEVNGAQVKVQIGKVKTNWLPIVSMVGDTNIWIPITVGEQVAVISPYGEMAQSFVIRSLHYNKYAAPENKGAISLKTKTDVKAESEGKLEALFKNGFELKSGDTYIYVYENSAKVKHKNTEISVSDGIQLSCGGSTIDLSDSNISLNSSSISTVPPVCKCAGGL
jgi:phage baseplate assembly protein gpV